MGVAVLQGFHVFCAILWFGGDMFSNFVVVPATNKIDSVHSNAFLAKFGQSADRYMLPMGALTIISGLILGIPLGAWTHLGQLYGNTYLAAFVLAAFVYLFGIFFLRRNINKAMAYEQGSAEFAEIIGRVKKYGGIILIGFLFIFIMMVALNFGY